MIRGAVVGTLIVIVGGAAGERAQAWKLAPSPRVDRIDCAPGNAGPAELAEAVPLGIDDLDGFVRAADRLRVDLVVVGPEAPLAAG